MTEKPYTHEVANPDERKWKLCTCSVCGTTEQCTPRSDYYTVGAPPRVGKPLLCESCFRTWSNNRGNAS